MHINEQAQLSCRRGWPAREPIMINAMSMNTREVQILYQPDNLIAIGVRILASTLFACV